MKRLSGYEDHLFRPIPFGLHRFFPINRGRTCGELIAGFLQGAYRVAPYIEMASRIQKLERPVAVATLRRFAASTDGSDKTIILCRMLYVNRKNSSFRRPKIGGAQFLGNTNYKDWPLEPIELVDSVPFLVVRSYMLAGEPERASTYLDYCLANCDWRTTRYTMKTPHELDAALHKLLASQKWKTPLKKYEEKFLSAQIKCAQPSRLTMCCSKRPYVAHSSLGRSRIKHEHCEASVG